MPTKTASSSRSRLARRTEHRRRQQTRRRFTYLLWITPVLLLLGLLTAAVWPSRASMPTEISLDKSLGEEDAPIVVVEYGDFQCPYCGHFALNVKPQLLQNYIASGQVRFVFRQFAFLGDESRWAAEASECANEQGRFWDYYDKVFQEQDGENMGAFSVENLKRFAAELGLDTGEFNQCLDSGQYADKVRDETLQGRRAGVSGTPTLFVNGRLIENGGRYEILQSAIESALLNGLSED